MKPLLQRYTKSQRIDFSSNSLPLIFSYEILPWIEKNTLAYDSKNQQIVQVSQYPDGAPTRQVGVLQQHESLQLIFNPRLKLGANNNVFTLDTSDNQRVKNKNAPILDVHSHATSVGFKIGDLVPGSLEELKTTLRQIEKYNDANGWLLDLNPFFWRYITSFITLIGDLGDSSGSLTKALGITDGRVYNTAYQILLLDWVVKHHKRMGDHAIPLVATLVSYINFDPRASREVLNEINSHHNRRQLSFERRLELLRELREIALSTTLSNKKLDFHAQRLSKKQFKPTEAFFDQLFANDAGVKPSTQHLERLMSANRSINWTSWRRQRDEGIRLADRVYTDAMGAMDNFHAYLQSLPDPLIVYKGGTTFSNETIRKSRGGKASESHHHIGDSHLKRIGSSFTVNPLVAEWFATRSTRMLADGPVRRFLPNGKLRPVVVRYSIPKKNVFLCYNLRSEAEVLVNQETTLRVIDYEFCYPSVTVSDYSRLPVYTPQSFQKMRLEDPSLKSARQRNTSHTSYPNRDNIVTSLHPMRFGIEWLKELKLHKKFIGGCYENHYDPKSFEPQCSEISEP
jgi:hypothetical protein